jgi:uncharacterized protein YaeQ
MVGSLKLPQGQAVALNATVYSFEITLNDADRGVYQALAFRAARHPSETAEFLLTRVLAYCLEFCEGIAFSKGLSDPDAPALAIRDLTGALKSWIDIGTPDTARLHRAAKAAPRVAVYSHKDVGALVAELAAGGIHRAQEIEIYALDRALLAGLAGRLAKRMCFDLAVSDRTLYLTFDDQTLTGNVTPCRAG